METKETKLKIIADELVIECGLSRKTALIQAAELLELEVHRDSSNNIDDVHDPMLRGEYETEYCYDLRIANIIHKEDQKYEDELLEQTHNFSQEATSEWNEMPF